MPFRKLVKLQYFSKKRIKQLFDDARIFIAWASSISKGKVLRDRKTGKRITLEDCIRRYAKVRGLLLALGYDIKHSKKTTPIFKKVFKKAWPLIKKWYKYYKGRVKKR